MITHGSATLFRGTPAEVKVTTTRFIDPDFEAQELAETETTNLTPQELDKLRCLAAGVPYISPREAEAEERRRPQKKTDEEASVGVQLRDLLQGIANGTATRAAETVTASKGIGFLDPSNGAPLTRTPSVAEGEVFDPIKDR